MDHLLVSARPFWTSFFRHNRVKRQDSLRVTRPQQNPARHFVVRADRGRGMAPDVLVTVVVPAYNAARTIGETLRSVRGQSHRNLEILVVDDGATDETAEIVRAHAVEDPRVRLLTQSNAGVAAARNRGIAEARGEFVATVDADDLWRWDKVERQLIAFAEAGDSVGLVYSWYARIDGRGDVIKMASVHPRGRDLLEALALRNFVGNGSSPMFRRSLAQAIGGYDPTLRARNAQGCEDWRFYFQAAERCDFALIPDYLVGYRLLPDAMSSDFPQMLRSGALCIQAALQTHPRLWPLLRTSQQRRMRWMFTNALSRRSLGLAVRILREMYRHSPELLLRALASLPLALLRNPPIWRRRPRSLRKQFRWSAEPQADRA
jgi:glycosyltransferase involved in cell wall biosynthesis